MNCMQDCVTELTELLLEAGGDPESQAGRRISVVLADWELVVMSKRLYNQKGMREMFARTFIPQKPARDPAKVE